MARNSAVQRDTILDFIKDHPACSSTEILQGIGMNISIATLKRTLQVFIAEGLLVGTGALKSRKYNLSPAYQILRPVNLDQYFEQEIDQRSINENFNHQLLRSTLQQFSIFSNQELLRLNQLQEKFRENASKLSEADFKIEMERLAIDLSWKSSQIEGNTYSLLETERLLKYKETAAGKTKDEATMLLNHKSAIDFIIDHPDYIHPLSVSSIEDIHSILVKELDISRNIRNRRVGISGTNYKPLDNVFQIKEALSDMCQLINHKENVFEKALLALVFISYIQPFSDGNKRTARIISNAILMQHHYCPISFRTINSVEYKKAMLVFYEQTNIHPFKRVFIDQFEFAVNTYF